MDNNINNLDSKFKHHSWFKKSELTKRQAIEYFATCSDFRLEKTPSKEQSTNLFDSINYDDVLVYHAKTKSKYKMTQEEKEYYLQRKAFWDNYKKEIWDKWNNRGNYIEWVDFEREQYMLIPEYASYREAYKKCS
jgi:hypothetical protein